MIKEKLALHLIYKARERFPLRSAVHLLEYDQFLDKFYILAKIDFEKSYFLNLQLWASVFSKGKLTYVIKMDRGKLPFLNTM